MHTHQSYIFRRDNLFPIHLMQFNKFDISFVGLRLMLHRVGFEWIDRLKFLNYFHIATVFPPLNPSCVHQVFIIELHKILCYLSNNDCEFARCEPNSVNSITNQTLQCFNFCLLFLKVTNLTMRLSIPMHQAQTHIWTWCFDCISHTKQSLS